MQYFMAFVVKMIYLVNSLMVLCEILNITSMKAIQSISYWQKTETIIYLINIHKGRSFVILDNFYGSNKTSDKSKPTINVTRYIKLIFENSFRNTNKNEIATNRLHVPLYHFPSISINYREFLFCHLPYMFIHFKHRVSLKKYWFLGYNFVNVNIVQKNDS